GRNEAATGAHHPRCRRLTPGLTHRGHKTIGDCHTAADDLVTAHRDEKLGIAHQEIGHCALRSGPVPAPGIAQPHSIAARPDRRGPPGLVRAPSLRRATMNAREVLAGLDGSVLLRGDREFEPTRRSMLWNAWKPSRSPELIVRAASEQDVIAAVTFA